jgi:hypothetical protein
LLVRPEQGVTPCLKPNSSINTLSTESLKLELFDPTGKQISIEAEEPILKWDWYKITLPIDPSEEYKYEEYNKD